MGGSGEITGHPHRSAASDIIDIKHRSKLAAFNPNQRETENKYHQQLTRGVKEKQRKRKAHRARRIAEEKEHIRNAHKFERRPGAGAPLRLANGKVKTTRGVPPGDPGEYKLLVAPQATLT